MADHPPLFTPFFSGSDAYPGDTPPVVEGSRFAATGVIYTDGQAQLNLTANATIAKVQKTPITRTVWVQTRQFRPEDGLNYSNVMAQKTITKNHWSYWG